MAVAQQNNNSLSSIIKKIIGMEFCKLIKKRQILYLLYVQDVSVYIHVFLLRWYMYVLYEYIIKYNCYILVLIIVINKKRKGP